MYECLNFLYNIIIKNHIIYEIYPCLKNMDINAIMRCYNKIFYIKLLISFNLLKSIKII